MPPAPEHAPAPTLRHWLAEAPFGLTLSSGFFGFYAHCGFVTALQEAGLSPARVSGSSAGALVAAGVATGFSPEEFRKELFALKREDFWDPFPGFGVLRGRLFRKRLEALLPVKTFAECPIPLAVSAFDCFSLSTVVLEEGLVAPAVHASCAVPFMFHPVWLQGRPLVDGGLRDRPGVLGMPKGQRLLFHHLASRSPWRKKRSLAELLPQREEMQTLVIEGLPRLGPNRLEEGPLAFEQARRATQEALARPLEEGVLQVAARDI